MQILLSLMLIIEIITHFWAEYLCDNFVFPVHCDFTDATSWASVDVPGGLVTPTVSQCKQINMYTVQSIYESQILYLVIEPVDVLRKMLYSRIEPEPNW